MNSSSAFKVECRNYSHDVSNCIFKFLINNQYTDVTLSAEGKFMDCHRLVLASLSPYFDLSSSTILIQLVFS
jgi:BTB/POZ domain